jgi:hypothetical protein
MPLMMWGRQSFVSQGKSSFEKPFFLTYLIKIKTCSFDELCASGCPKAQPGPLVIQHGIAL